MNIISPIARHDPNLRPVAGPAIAGAAEMSTMERDGVALGAPALDDLLPAAAADADGPIRVHGKFFFAGDTKHFVKGVTYGPFPVGTHGTQFPEPATVERDFALMRGAGINTVRVFTVPPVWLLDVAGEAGLKVMVGLPWSQHVAFLDGAAVNAE